MNVFKLMAFMAITVLAGCASFPKESVLKTEYVNECASYPLPAHPNINTYPTISEEYSFTLDNTQYLVIDYASYEDLSLSIAKIHAYTDSLKDLVILCRKLPNQAN